MAVSKRLRFEIFRRDNHTCRYCGRAAPEVKLRPDHVVPVALGGSDDPSNLVTSCDDCNSGKSSVAPDSPVVAQVQDDALRWAQAQKAAAAAMLKEHQAHAAVIDQFGKRWDYWTTVQRKNAWLSQDWQHSVQCWLEAGLPIELIIDCLDKAMRKANLRPGDVFKYTCGIAWGRVRELREHTSRLVQPAGSESGTSRGELDIEFMKGWNAGTEEFAEAVFEYIDLARIDEFIATAKASAIENGDEFDDEGPDREDPYLQRLGAIQGIAEMYEEYRGYEHAVRKLIDALPERLLAELHSMAIDEYRSHGLVPTGDDIQRWMLFLMAERISKGALS